MSSKDSGLLTGFYWVRLFDMAERESYWTIRFYNRRVRGSSLSFPLDTPDEEGHVVDMWGDRPYGFYWMHCPHWDGDAPQVNGWSIAEFIGDGWRVTHSDELWTDNDMQRYPVVGPISLPSKNTSV